MEITYFKSILVAGIFMVFGSSCGDVDNTNTESHGIILENMDTSVDPKKDFYNYVNGAWMKDTEIPDDQTTWGGFMVLRKKTDKNVLAILDKAQKSNKYAADSDQAKAMAIFSSKMDMEARNELGIEPIKEVLAKIDMIKTIADFQKVITEDAIEVEQPFLGFTAFSNPSNSSMNSCYVTSGGLGLGDRDYYIKTDSKSEEIRGQYIDHITRMLQFLGDSEAGARTQAEKILAFETRLAVPRYDKVQSRDFRNYNNPRSIAELQSIVPAIKWAEAFTDIGVKTKMDTVLVMQPQYMTTVSEIMKEGDIELWKATLRWGLINSAAGQLTEEIETANWEFYSKTLRGAKKQRPADERALATVNETVGEALGQLYVDEMFPPEAKQKAERMIFNVIDAYKDRIIALDWMSAETKLKAIQKLDKFVVKIGYPNEWKDYSTMAVSATKGYYENMLAVAEWSSNENLSKINQPVDKKEWGLSPQTVNAYFNPFNNEIVFPAAILQPPFYDYKADDAVNYGGIGAVIGHEISHAFDDSGARFDSDGNLVNWWTESDLEEFTKRGDALADQYSAIEVLDSVFINGKFTLGENIGDLGGVLGAYDGLQKFYAENGRPDDIDGFTAEQRFFMSWATVWRTKIRDEALRTQVQTDPHSPGRSRAIQPLQNIDAFYTAFDIKDGDDMYVAPSDRVRIW